MRIKPTTKDAFNLLMQGSLVLARMEAAGISIDEAYLEATSAKVGRRITRLATELKRDEVWRTWRKRFGEKALLTSDQQLTTVLFDVLKHPYPEGEEWRTGTGRYRADEEMIGRLKLPFCKTWRRLKKLQRLRGTYLNGIKREVVNGRVHPSINLHTVETYRSSASDPNIQNQYNRDPEMKDLLRKCYVPSPGCVLVEVDFSTIEVRISCALHRDPTLMEYMRDETKDMHRDTAAELYDLPVAFLIEHKDWAKKGPRDWAKNRFVFPQFYGSVWFQCAPHLWEPVAAGALMPDGKTTVREHLKSTGVKRLGRCTAGQDPESGTFGERVREVERSFWDVRFPVYTAWKRKTYDRYLEKGYIDTLTGFRLAGHYRRNEVLNSDIQGCLAGPSRVLTSGGWIPIKELVDKHVQVWTGFRWADAVGMDRGRCQRAIIRLSSGLMIRCDTRHKLKNEMDEWVDFENLKVGDWVALSNHGKYLEASEDMNWWFVFGFIIGDGCISSRERRNVTITVGRKKRGILEKIKEFLVAQGYKDGGYGGVHWRVIPPSGNKNEKYCLYTQNAELAAFLESNGFVFGWKSRTKRLPDSVWTASPQEQRDFMEGLWLSDGCRGPLMEKNLHMSARKLQWDVQRLCSAIGFDSIQTDYRLKFHWRTEGARPTRKFPAAALTRLANGVRRENYKNGMRYVVENRTYLLAKKGVDPTQSMAERIIKNNMTDKPPVYRYDWIESIKVLDYEETTYTMSVDDPLHQFVADGVLHKNSSFHCLLWSLIEIINNELRRRRMKAWLVAEIHDALLADVPRKEVQTFLDICHEVMTERLPKAWRWINVPITTESEVCEENWAGKVQWTKQNGMWKPK